MENLTGLFLKTGLRKKYAKNHTTTDHLKRYPIGLFA